MLEQFKIGSKYSAQKYKQKIFEVKALWNKYCYDVDMNTGEFTYRLVEVISLTKWAML